MEPQAAEPSSSYPAIGVRQQAETAHDEYASTNPDDISIARAILQVRGYRVLVEKGAELSDAQMDECKRLLHLVDQRMDGQDWIVGRPFTEGRASEHGSIVFDRGLVGEPVPTMFDEDGSWPTIEQVESVRVPYDDDVASPRADSEDLDDGGVFYYEEEDVADPEESDVDSDEEAVWARCFERPIRLETVVEESGEE